MTPARSATGFFGKIPARGDFVAAGLAKDAISGWERWINVRLTESRVALGETWRDAWLEAPVWNFALPAGMCGGEPLLGLWMPSVDSVGRYFPLMIGAVCPHAAPRNMQRCGASWLQAAEMAGRRAVGEDISPDALLALIPPSPEPADAEEGPREAPGGLWWTDGAPRVPPRCLVSDAMPDAATFVTMLDAAARIGC